MEEYYDLNDFISSIKNNRILLEKIVFEKIKKSIEEKTEKTCILNLMSEKEEVISFYLHRKEYQFFLESYLKICELREEYEICSDILTMRNLL